MSPLLIGPLVLAAGDPDRIVGLFTGQTSPLAPSLALWRIALIALGIGAIAVVAGISTWRLRTSGFDAAERAFVSLARRGGVSPGARALLRRAAAAHGCHPVALLVSRQALDDALEALQRSGDGAAERECGPAGSEAARPRRV